MAVTVSDYLSIGPLPVPPQTPHVIARGRLRRGFWSVRHRRSATWRLEYFLYGLDSCADMFMEWRAGKPITVLGSSQFIGRNAMQEFLTFAIGVPQARAVRQCDVTRHHPVGDIHHG